MNNPIESLSMVRLLNMSKRKALEFSDKVATSHGLVYAYMHPYYPDRKPFITRKENFLSYAQQRDTEIPALLAAGKPVVIFEESRHVRELPTRIGKLPKCATLYVVSTMDGDPDPIRSSWDRVGDVLQTANVRTISFGGSFIDFQDIGIASPFVLRSYANPAYGDAETQRWKFKGMYHITDGCAGIAADELAKRNFFISHSQANFSLSNAA